MGISYMVSTTIQIADSMIFWAFRYCLGRGTYAVADCVDNLLSIWERLRPDTRDLIHKEILEAIASNRIGMTIDKQEWLRVVERWNNDNMDKLA